MRKEVQVQKTLIPKDQYRSLVDTSFTYFNQAAEEETGVSVDEFFELYNKLYFDIPIEGDINSHEYLLKRSGELVTMESDTTDINLLLEEVTQLREQLLLANQQIFTLQSTTQQDE